MRAVLIINPTSGISTVTEQRISPEETECTILEGLRVNGLEPQVLHTTPEDTGKGLARRAAGEGAELVIAAGGDGTIHAVANGLIGTQSILGIIPIGTMNNLARSLSIPETIPAACYTLFNGKTRTIQAVSAQKSNTCAHAHCASLPTNRWRFRPICIPLHHVSRV